MNKFIIYLLLITTSVPLIAKRRDRKLKKKIPAKVLICGICKNVEEQIPYSIAIVERIGRMFEDYRAIVYENNSTDRSKEILQDWAGRNHKVDLMTETIPHEKLVAESVNITIQGNPFYTEPIARARNIVLDKALSNEYEGYDYILWMDMDFVIAPNYYAIKEVFRDKRNWDAVFAFGVNPAGEYYDTYAFRDKRIPIGPELLGNWWHTDIQKELVLSPRDDWYPVISAFGGFGIYKKSSVQGCRYTGYVTKNVVDYYANYLNNNSQRNNPLINKYLKDKKSITEFLKLPRAKPGLNKLNESLGIIIDERHPDLHLRVNSGTHQFPSMCEHVVFHIEMHRKGHSNLFVNPRLLFHYESR